MDVMSYKHEYIHT